MRRTTRLLRAARPDKLKCDNIGRTSNRTSTFPISGNCAFRIQLLVAAIVQNCAFICLYSIIQVEESEDCSKRGVFQLTAIQRRILLTVNKWLLDYCFLQINEQSFKPNSVGSGIFWFFWSRKRICVSETRSSWFKHKILFYGWSREPYQLYLNPIHRYSQTLIYCDANNGEQWTIGLRAVSRGHHAMQCHRIIRLCTRCFHSIVLKNVYSSSLILIKTKWKSNTSYKRWL